MSSEPTLTRRTVLRGAAGAATAGAALSSANTAAAQSSGEPNYGGWFDNVSNYDGTVDKTGQSTVTITVGASGNGGNYAFSPAAVRVDPGTKIVWKWSGKGSMHNVVAENGAFESELTGEKGHTFSYTVTETGIIKYACAPHKPMGMKGALVVGSATGAGASGGDAKSAANSTAQSTSGGGTGASEPNYGGWFDNVSNYDGTVDKTGQSEVTITVGASGNEGNYAFSPAAVRVDPGTKITWKWSGKGGTHNVVAENGAFESELTGEKGHTFSHTVEQSGIIKYACVPHKPMGMKGALVVGDGGASAATDSNLGESIAIGGGIGLLGFLLGLFVLGTRENTPSRETGTSRTKQ